MAPTSKSALIVVDPQEDFCPPHGTLAVPQGRDIIPIVNELLEYPFAYRVITKDWHPSGHISFASSHAGKEAYTSTITIVNPFNASESYESQVWPDHCIQNTQGAEIVPGIDISRFDKMVEKGSRMDVDMFSGFYAPLKDPRVCDSGLAKDLRERNITHVYIVGLAADYCVKSTAIDAANERFETYIVEEGTRAVDVKEWEKIKLSLADQGVKIVSIDSEEVKKVQDA